jgi:hypothetical protein
MQAASDGNQEAPPPSEAAALARSVRQLGVAAALALATQIVITLCTGAAQEPLERVLAPAAYQAVLLAHPAALRAVFTVDSVFLVLYAAFFVQLGRALAPAGRPGRALVQLAAAAMLGTAFLDAVENQHILSLLAGAEHGLVPDAGAIVAQAAASQLKFHLSYFAVFLIGLALPRRTVSERALAAGCLYVQLPLGLLAFVAPPPWQDVLVYVRWAFYFGGFLLLGRDQPARDGVRRLPVTAVKTT